MTRRSLENWKEEYTIIKCEVCGCDVKTTHALRRYCYDCRFERNKIATGMYAQIISTSFLTYFRGRRYLRFRCGRNQLRCKRRSRYPAN